MEIRVEIKEKERKTQVNESTYREVSVQEETEGK